MSEEPYTFEEVDRHINDVANALAGEGSPLVAAMALGILKTERGYECAGHPRLRQSAGPAAAAALVRALREMADLIEKRNRGDLQ